MPPKKAKSAPIEDWSWVGTEVKTVDAITEDHRLRAAGLKGIISCPFPAATAAAQSSTDNASSDGDVKLIKDTACTEKRCKGNVGCLNHLGAEEAVKLAKKDYIAQHLGDKPTIRDGPAGLRNLGATCYANAFLQMWYHNPALRDGVYRAVTSSVPTPLFHLGAIFAALELSDRPVVDPTPLLDSLKLEKADQQDAAEFSKLFTDLIAKAFRYQQDEDVRNLMNDLYEGQVERSTQCLSCGYVSRKQESFLELDIHLTNGATIMDCLQSGFVPEQLEGDNQYHCPHCNSKQNAVRSQRLSRLPPILNLALMRFTYSAASNNRVKSKAAIKYGKRLILEGFEYELRAVLTHLGTSAHHGHFVCEVYDQQSDGWLHCNDEVVTVPDRKKRRRIDSPDLDFTSSKDAYMLVYHRQSFKRPRPPSQPLQDLIEASNADLSTQLDDVKHRGEVRLDEYLHMDGAKRDVIKVLPGTDRLVPRTELVRWFKATTLEDMFFEWDPWTITCIHGGISPLKTHEARCISAEAFDKLASYNPGMNLADLSICPLCIEDEFTRRIARSNHGDAVTEFGRLNTSGEYVVSRRWIDDWHKRRAQDTPTTKLYCHHEARWGRGVKTMTISDEAVVLLRSVVGDFDVFLSDEPECAIYAEEIEGDKQAEEERATLISVERPLRKQMDIKPAPFGMDFYLLPEKFADEWQQWQRNGLRPKKLDMDLCAHGKLDWDPMMKMPHYITAEGWKSILENYGDAPPVVIRFDANPMAGKRTPVVSVNPAVCDECRIAQALAFETATIYIVRDQAGAKRITEKRARRSTVNEFEIQVKKSTTVKDIKLEICSTYGLSPICQKLWYGDKELDKSEDTVESMKILADDRIRLEVIQEVHDVDEVEVHGRREGFGGTALLGSRSCPHCTYINAEGAVACEVCGGDLEDGLVV